MTTNPLTGRALDRAGRGGERGVRGMNDAIPEYVLTALETVRASGVTNMLARPVVMHECRENEDDEAVTWLYDNERRYMEALRAMGERRKKQQ